MLSSRRLFLGMFLTACLFLVAASAADKKPSAPQYRWDAWIVTPKNGTINSLSPIGDAVPEYESCGPVPSGNGVPLWQDVFEARGCWYSGQNTDIAAVYAKQLQNGYSVFHFATSPAHPIRVQSLIGSVDAANYEPCASPIVSAKNRPDCLLDFLNTYPQPQVGFSHFAVNFTTYTGYDPVQQPIGDLGKVPIYSTSFDIPTPSFSQGSGVNVFGSARKPYATGEMWVTRIAQDYWKVSVNTPLHSPDIDWDYALYEQTCSRVVQGRKTLTTCEIMSWAQPGSVNVKFEMIFRRTLVP